MSFIEAPQSQLPKELGSDRAKILIIVPCPGKVGLKERKMFAGPESTILEQCMHQAGLTYADVKVTALFYDYGERKKLVRGTGKNKKLKVDAAPYVERVQELISRIHPTLILPAGDAPCIAFLQLPGPSTIRGYPFIREGQLHIPLLDPADMVWSNYIWRWYLAHDLMKARKYIEGEATPQSAPKVTVPNDIHEARELLKRLAKAKQICFDIEVINFTTACIGFKSEDSKPIVIPYAGKWSKEEELELWDLTVKVLEAPSVKLGQNLIFDIHFLAQQHGIFVKGPIHDTMIAHSILYPDFLKGLNFLASIYTDLPYWKDMVTFKSIKKED